MPGAAGIARMADLSAREQARLISGLADLDRDADLILVDTGAGVGREILAFIDAADLPIIVTTPEPTAIADAYALMKCVSARRGAEPDRGNRPVLVVNQVVSPEEAAAVHARINLVSQKFLGLEVPLLGWIAQDPSVGASVRRRRPLMLEHAKSAAARDLRLLGDALTRAVCPAETRAASRTGLAGWLSRMILRGG